MTSERSDVETFILTYGAPATGAMFSSALAMGPLGAVLGVRKNGDLGEVNPDPLPILFANCIAWCMYGAASKNYWVFLGNITGTIIGLFYVVSIFSHATPPVRRRLEIITLPLFSLVVISGFATSLLPAQYGSETSGYVANGLVFVVFSSPLTTLGKVITTRNSASINRPFGIIMVLNCATWTVYAAFIHDMYLLVPNVFGLALGIVQVLLMVIFPAGSPDTPLLADSLLADAADPCNLHTRAPDSDHDSRAV